MSLSGFEALAVGLNLSPKGLVGMLFGYFDESGTDGQHDITIISGFVGRLEDWMPIKQRWDAARDADDIDCFHYVDCVNREGEYKGWDLEEDSLPHLNRMAEVLVDSPIAGVTAGFLGNWNRVLADNPKIGVRFPSAYSFCFEMLVEKIRREANYHGIPEISLFFSKQKEFESRANEVWDWHEKRGSWPEIYQIGFNWPKKVSLLQTADMLAYESRRYLFRKDTEYWKKQPLLSRLLPKHYERGNALYEIAYDEARVPSLPGILGPGNDQ